MLRPSLLQRSRSVVQVFRFHTRFFSLREHQTQGILAQYGIPVSRARLATRPADVAGYIYEIGRRCTTESQVLPRGNGTGTFEDGTKGGAHFLSSSVLITQALELIDSYHDADARVMKVKQRPKIILENS